MNIFPFISRFVRRRSFIAGAAAFAAAPVGAAASPAYSRVTLGKTGLSPSMLGFGTGVHGWNRASNLTRMGRETAVKLLRAAYDRGVRFFDLADSYGSHPLLAEALSGVPRDSYVVCTKYAVGGAGIPKSDRADAHSSVERFLRELKTDYVDIVQLHCMTASDWTTKFAEHMEGLSRAKAEGKIRAHGASFHSYSALAAGAKSEWLEVAHVRLNPFGKSMHTHPSRVIELVWQMHAAGKGVIAMKVLGEGALSKSPEKIDESVRWLLKSGAVDVLNIGFESIAQVDDMAARIAAAKNFKATASNYKQQT